MTIDIFSVGFNTLAYCDDDCYAAFNAQFEKHLARFPNPKFKSVIAPLVENGLITIGYPDAYKNIILGKVLTNPSGRIAAIIVNQINHDIDRTGNSSQFDVIVGSVYYVLFEYLLGSISQQKNKLLKDTKLISRVINYYETILLKNLKLYELHEEKQKLAKAIVRYFFHRFLLEKNHTISYDSAIEDPKLRELINEDLLSKYRNITNLFDALYDLNVTKVPPNNLRYILTNLIGIHAYIAITTSLSMCIMGFVLSKYKHPHFAKLFLSAEQINSIEESLINDYLVHVEFDLESFKKNYIKVRREEI